ncbi:hypothetical protein DFQ28_005378 [Apophysomyces sp. BC1034]|nr:hypothetical protein DFQ30_005397 [Apophysomyces sp. BC1015]KAG0172073.1 hypothetical protein DFQ29_008535 [Apophysomyces sp. BC1021]KAG0188089.1 hypothetical protein DFQ28_005378 [Apophysomyces sp. BC1034]
MPHIQPFPQDAYAQPLPDLQQQYSVYRPAYHHRTSTPTSLNPRQFRETRNTNTPEVSPVVVPSMSPYADYHSAASYYYLNGIYDRQLPTVPMPTSSYHQPYHVLHQPITVHPPIHHTLENATITYDTVVEQTHVQRDLVKDVFFSPAMITSATTTRATSPSEASTCSQSDDSESETDSPKMTPSDLLLEKGDHLLFFTGFDLPEPLEDEKTVKVKPALSLRFQDAEQPHCFLNTTDNLPTPPAEADYLQLGHSLKRKPSSFLSSEICQKKQKQHWGQQSTPPASPAEDPLFDNEGYFDDASAEESSDDDDDDDDDERSITTTNVNYRRSGFQSFSSLDDDFSTPSTSWETQAVDLLDENEVSDSDLGEDDEADLAETNKCRHQEQVESRPTAQPTLYQKLTKANIDWCRYCGTTEGVNWRPGPWGKRTLCNKHGCDYKGYGFACKLPRLDLTGFVNESIDDRDRPVLQLFCSVCHRQESWAGNVLVRCEGCPKAFHQKCCPTDLTDEFVASDTPWFCDLSCCENARRKRIVVELPRKRLPLMCAPKNTPAAVENNSSNTRMRSLRESSR